MAGQAASIAATPTDTDHEWAAFELTASPSSTTGAKPSEVFAVYPPEDDENIVYAIAPASEP